MGLKEDSVVSQALVEKCGNVQVSVNLCFHNGSFSGVAPGEERLQPQLHNDIRIVHGRFKHRIRGTYLSLCVVQVICNQIWTSWASQAHTSTSMRTHLSPPVTVPHDKYCSLRTSQDA